MEFDTRPAASSFSFLHFKFENEMESGSNLQNLASGALLHILINDEDGRNVLGD